MSSFDSNHVLFPGTGGQNQPGQQGQHIYTEYQSLGPNNGLHGPYSGPKEGQRPTLREPLVYIPVPGPDGNRVPLVKVCEAEIICCKSDMVLSLVWNNFIWPLWFKFAQIFSGVTDKNLYL